MNIIIELTWDDYDHTLVEETATKKGLTTTGEMGRAVLDIRLIPYGEVKLMMQVPKGLEGSFDDSFWKKSIPTIIDRVGTILRKLDEGTQLGKIGPLSSGQNN